LSQISIMTNFIDIHGYIFSRNVMRLPCNVVRDIDHLVMLLILQVIHFFFTPETPLRRLMTKDEALHVEM